MNPRVSRSSALASKATGFPIAKIAAKLALGYHLDEIPNDITRLTPASFEPTIDYVVVKVPRWTFEKFPARRPDADHADEVGRRGDGDRPDVQGSLHEGVRARSSSARAACCSATTRERTHTGLTAEEEEGALQRELSVPNDRRMWAVFRALRPRLDRRRGARADDDRSVVPRAVLAARRAAAIRQSRRLARDLARHAADPEAIRVQRPRAGAASSARTKRPSRNARVEHALKPAYKRIDTCAAEFESFTPYLYGTYEQECEAEPTPRQKVVILGSGPNRIGQGIEFDYCCCHAAFALREEGFETVMVNCNPETVSTDYDTVDRLYFEPLTFEDVSSIIAREREAGGDVSCVVQYGGQTPLKLALSLQEAGVKIIGTSPDSIDLAEDRERFAQLLWDLGIPQAPSGTAMTPEEAREVAEKIGFPLVVRPSYVLGGRAMAIVYDMAALDRYMIDRGVRITRASDPDRQVPRRCGRARR